MHNARIRVLTVFVVATFVLVSFGRHANADPPPRRRMTLVESAALDALSPDPDVAARARRDLRASGEQGLAALITAFPADVALLRQGHRGTDRTARVREAIDAVAAQRDAHASGLYWYTDLDAAKREAARRRVPILSLRMLGRLDEELSCANSRYFRILLYSNPAIAETLRTRYVLHWSSERPVPRITIDFGDGRTIERTISGNSVHYILDPIGRVLDAIPGLYDASGFHAALLDGLNIAAACAPVARPHAYIEPMNTSTPELFARCLREQHISRTTSRATQWERLSPRSGISFEELGARELPVAERDRTARGEVLDTVAIAAAERVSMSKMILEIPLVRVLQRSAGAAQVPAELPEAIRWEPLARPGVTPLDPSSLALLTLKLGAPPSEEMLAQLTLSARADALRNDLVLHDRIATWIAASPAPLEMSTLNARVYDELFLTPASDPWLGLASPEIFDGLERARQ